MDEAEIRAFVREKFNEAWNGQEASDAAEKAIVAAWLKDRDDFGLDRWSEGNDAGYSDGYSVGLENADG